MLDRACAMLIAVSAAGSCCLAQYPQPKSVQFPSYAQFLTEEALKRHPDALVIAFHAVIPATHCDGATTFCVVCNFKDKHEATEFFRGSQGIRDEIAPLIKDIPLLLERKLKGS